MFITRLISGIIVLAIAIAMMLIGGNILFLFVSAISLIGIYELYKTIGIEKSLIGYAGYLGTVIYEIFIWTGITNGGLMGAALAALIIMTVYVVKFPEFKADQAFCAITGVVYVAVLMSFIYLVRMLPSGLYIVPMIFVCAWGNDTCAYCVGMLIGKKKIFPVLSPKKSLEGFIGGLVGAAVIGGIYGTVLSGYLTFASPAVACAIIGAAGALIAVVGDLAASAIKRDKGIKDYSNLIPGHVGILDRFDSILFTAPIVYILAVLLGA